LFAQHAWPSPPQAWQVPALEPLAMHCVPVAVQVLPVQQG
jgi:hypothetical protein